MRASAEPDRADEWRASAAKVAAGCGLKLCDFERALHLCSMSPREYLRHETAVAEVLKEAGAPIRSRLIEIDVRPVFSPDLLPDRRSWLARLWRSAAR